MYYFVPYVCKLIKVINENSKKVNLYLMSALERKLDELLELVKKLQIH